MEAGTLIDYETPAAPIPDYETEQCLHPRCPGCNAPIFWIDEERPYCRCGALLFWPVPERI